ESAIVLVCMGAFFAIEDPVGKFKKHAQLYYDYAYVDGLTGLFNRRAYSEELDKFKEVIPEDIVCLELDLNELKYVNDNIGHDAGDELIREAARLIKEAFGQYGKVFRTGGDEFSAILQTSHANYEKAKSTLKEACSNWSGVHSNQMRIAVGAGFKEDTDKGVLDIFSVADQRMYQEKEEYYRLQGVDRRKQAAAHKALCNLYTKILKINITDDTYVIVDMDAAEQTSEKGFTHTISGWLSGFGKSGQVHAEDLDGYLAKTDIAFLSDYFKSGKTSITIYYRRKYDQIFKQVAMEMIPADDYTNENQTLFLYVKDIDM
ncbi:MAG: GGDEF domain-containing protein, partial [Lachnospiraceae bacterium]|nr:GGDEF domain-containing protein [Lachnospiraceae bacterium]